MQVRQFCTASAPTLRPFVGSSVDLRVDGIDLDECIAPGCVVIRFLGPEFELPTEEVGVSVICRALLCRALLDLSDIVRFG